MAPPISTSCAVISHPGTVTMQFDEPILRLEMAGKTRASVKWHSPKQAAQAVREPTLGIPLSLKD
jgi:hypothetical protein